MIILDNDYKIKEIEPINVFENSKPIIYSLVRTAMADFSYCREDMIQECALRFFEYGISHYDHTKGVIIGKYLQTIYRNAIRSFLWREKRNTFKQIDDVLTRVVRAADIHNWEIENMPFADKLTAEQVHILHLVLEGYEYSEICDIVCPNNRTNDKKRPIYRRMVQIKKILSAFYELDYAAPRSVS